MRFGNARVRERREGTVATDLLRAWYASTCGPGFSYPTNRLRARLGVRRRRAGHGGVSDDESLRRAFHRNFELLQADTAALREEVFRLRYQVYCVENSYEPRHASRLERDAFDERSAHMLLRHRATGLAAGTVRLVMRETPHQALPMELFCQEAFDASARRRMRRVPPEHVGEISRFAISKEFRRRFAEHLTTSGITERNLLGDAHQKTLPSPLRRATSQLTVGLFTGIFWMSEQHELTYLYAVMEPSLMRLLERFGLRFEHLGRPVAYHGLRQPALAYLPSLTDAIRHEHPDIWTLVTSYEP